MGVSEFQINIIQNGISKLILKYNWPLLSNVEFQKQNAITYMCQFSSWRQRITNNLSVHINNVNPLCPEQANYDL